MAEDSTEPKLLPHHEQQDLCSTRLPYRQGRKLTAVKTYTVNNESRHLLVFGVPSLSLRQEAKSLFSRFGRLQFYITKYPAEQFTETYHAIYEDIQSARLAKKMLDTRNFYGGILHISYAPELETLEDTRAKLLKRQRSVVGRLINLQKATVNNTNSSIIQPVPENKADCEEEVMKKLYMGHENNIGYGVKRTADYKSVQHCKLKKSRNFDRKSCVTVTENPILYNKEVQLNSDRKSCVAISENPIVYNKEVQPAKVTSNSPETDCEVVDFTSTESDVLTNINDNLNYNNFGNEVIKTVPYKPPNKIKFNLNKKSLIYFCVLIFYLI